MNKKTYIGKILATLDRRWKINSKKETDFDKAVDITFNDVQTFLNKNPAKVISRSHFMVVHDNTVFKDQPATSERVARTSFNRMFKSVFKSGLERCIPISILLDMIEVMLESEFMFITEADTIEKPAKGFTLKTIK